MKIYSLAKIKKSFSKQNPEIAHNVYNNILSPPNLFDNMGLNQFYIKDINDKAMYVTDDDLSKISLFVKLKLKGQYNLSLIKEEENLDLFIKKEANNYEEVKEVLKNHFLQPHIKAMSNNKKEEDKSKRLENQSYSKNINNYEVNIDNKKIVSVDFEFDPNTLSYSGYNIKSCSECGISILEDNQIKNYHFIIEDGYQKEDSNSKHLMDKFEFGKTEIIQSSELLLKLQDIFKDADYMLAHGIATELYVLTKNGIVLPEKTELLDTYKMFLKMDENKVLNSYRLKDIMRTCELDSQNVHNAGNDSAYTLLTFMNMNQMPNVIMNRIQQLADIYNDFKVNKKEKLIVKFK